MPRVAAAAYPLSQLQDWSAYEAKQRKWISEAAEAGAEILIFPEYGGAELASLGGTAWGADDFGAIDAITKHTPKSEEILTRLAAEFGVYILTGSAPLRDGEKIVNRTALIGPKGGIGHQDKLLPTRWEREALGMAGGDAVHVYDTPLGMLGIAICYDGEFPLVARSMVESGAKLILAPSCTETTAGYWRVRIGGMARALENQCWVAHAPLIGDNDWLEMVETNTGAAAIYGPPDRGFPETGISALGEINAPGWIIADCDLEAVDRVRRDGGVLNHANWDEQDERLERVKTVSLG